MSPPRLLLYLWASPNTLLGLLAAPAALVTGGRVRCVAGVVEIHGGLIALLLRYCMLLRGGASAMTLGHVVLGRDAARLDATRAHERIHVRQYERWGPLFLPAYAIASIVALTKGKQPYRDNFFERQAFETMP